MAEVEPRTAPVPVPEVPGYQVIRVLGEGGFGLVLQARSLALGRMVALKVLKPARAHPQVRARFLREAKLLVGAREEGLMPILDADLEADPPFLVLPFLPGGDLARRIPRGAAPPAEVLGVGSRLARALGSLHRRGIVHRDVKPANVLLDEAGQAWLGDLGLGRAQDDATLTGTGLLVGTLAYLAPEILTGGGYSPSTDVFALGVVLVELAAGRRLGALAGNCGELHELLESLGPPGLRRALAPLVRLGPEDRPADGDEAAALLAEAEVGFDAPGAPGAPGAPAPETTETTLDLPPRGSGPRTPMPSAPPPAGSASGPRQPVLEPSAPAPPRRGGAGRFLLPWALLAVALLGFLASRPGPEPVGPAAEGPVRVAPWDAPDFEARFRTVLAGLAPSVRESYRDPAAWPGLVRRLPGGEEFQAWLATGGPGPDGLDRELAARLAALDRELAAQGLPAVFGPSTSTWRSPRPATPQVAASPIPFPAREVTGWFATAVEAGERLAPEITGMAQAVQAGLKDPQGGPLGEIPASLRLGVQLGNFENVANQRSFFKEAWADAGLRRELARLDAGPHEVLARLAYAIGQSLRHEPRTREWAAAWFGLLVSSDLRVACFSTSAYVDPAALLAGATGSPAAEYARGAVLLLQADVREHDPEARKALVDAGAAALRNALDEPAADGPPNYDRAEAAFFRLTEVVVAGLPAEDLADLWRRHLSPRASADPPQLARMAARLLDHVAFHSERARDLAPLAAAVQHRIVELHLALPGPDFESRLAALAALAPGGQGP